MRKCDFPENMTTLQISPDTWRPQDELHGGLIMPTATTTSSADLVVAQRVVSSKRLVTHLALVRFFTRVTAMMCRQTARCRETFLAHSTLRQSQSSSSYNVSNTPSAHSFRQPHNNNTGTISCGKAICESLLESSK